MKGFPLSAVGLADRVLRLYVMKGENRDLELRHAIFAMLSPIWRLREAFGRRLKYHRNVTNILMGNLSIAGTRF